MQVVVIAKEPLAGNGQDKAVPAVDFSRGGRRGRGGIGGHARSGRCTGVQCPVVAFEGEPVGWVPGGFIVVPQRRGRSASAWPEQSTTRGNATGSRSCSSAWTRRSVTAALERGGGLLSPGVDTVLGPADDGGYWLIGIRRPEPGMFADVPMSTDQTASDQLSGSKLGLDLSGHPRTPGRGHDFDDAHAVRSSPHSSFAAPCVPASSQGSRARA